MCDTAVQNGDNFDVTVTLKLIAGKSGLKSLVFRLYISTESSDFATQSVHV